MPVRETYERTTIRLEAIEIEPADPFQIAHDCINPGGHDFIADCSDVVCIHCARIAWQ